MIPAAVGQSGPQPQISIAQYRLRIHPDEYLRTDGRTYQQDQPPDCWWVQEVCINGSRKEETMVKGSSNGETYIALTRKLHVETLEYIW